MPIDASIPLSAKAPDTMASIASIVQTARGVQAYQTGKAIQSREQTAATQEAAALDARNAVAKVVNDPQYHDPETGLFDLNRASPAIVQADPQNYVASDIISKLASANSSLIAVKKAALGLADTSRQLVGSTVGALATKPDLTKADINSTLDELRAQAPDAAPVIDIWKSRLKSADVPDNPQVLQQAVIRARGQVMPPATQQSAQTPSGVQVDNGQGSAVVNTNPGAGPWLPVGAPIPGTTVQKQLPPTTPVFDPNTSTPGYQGPTGPVPGGAAGGGGGTVPNAPPSGASQVERDQYRLKVLLDERRKEENNPDPAARAQNLAALDTEIKGVQRQVAQPGTRPAFVASGPKLGTAENVAGTVDTVNKDWAATVGNANTASQDIGVLQNIKQFARGAVMGVANDRRAFIAGLAGLLHMDTAQLEKTNTDLLAKNSNMLALAGGDTNLARTMAEMANPNGHMTPEAAEDAANQVIGQRKMALIKQQFMRNFKSDPEQYSKELAEFNKVADPRILQLPDMTREAKARMKAAMSPTEQREFGQKIRKMQAMGLVQ
jgi:hypothetical protein